MNSGSAIATIGAFTGSSNCGEAPGSKVKPPDALIIEVAEVQCAVRPNDQSVWIVDLAVRKAGHAIPNQSRHACCHRRTSGQTGQDKNTCASAWRHLHVLPH